LIDKFFGLEINFFFGMRTTFNQLSILDLFLSGKGLAQFLGKF